MSSIINGAGLNSFRSQFSAGTSYALAEIIDNSIQWKRKDLDCEIKIIMIEHGKPGRWRLDEILIIDNGVGMNMEIISSCLNFGGGSNHGTEESGKLGKFGLGLPYSSCSQSPNYHVFSWMDKNNIFTTFRNHLKFKPNEPVQPEPTLKISSLPNYFYDLLPDLYRYESGTIVNWRDCDRLDVSQSKTLINHINLNLGRIYRHFIGNGVKIDFVVFRTTDSKYFEKVVDLCQPIKVFDPLFLMKNTVLPPPYNLEATNVPWNGKNGSGEDQIDFKENLDGEIRTHIIKLRYSIVKEEIQAIQGNTTLKEKYYKKAQGISLVRANRELKNSDFGFGFANGNDDTRHRWWSLEVLFEPISDDLLGLNANKLDAKNFRYLSSDDFNELEQNGMIDESTRLRHELSIKIKRSIDEMSETVKKRNKGARSRRKCPACNEVAFINGKCETCGYSSEICPEHGIQLNNGKCILCDRTPTIPMCIYHNLPLEQGKCSKCTDINVKLSEEEREELINVLKADYPEIKDNQDALDKILSWFIKTNKKYFIVFTDLRAPSIFINPIDFQNGKFTIIEVNTKHPFYENFIQQLMDQEGSTSLTAFLLFIACWIHTESKDYSNDIVLERFRSKFGANLMELIANWSEI
jgi:hypothetical protein